MEWAASLAAGVDSIDRPNRELVGMSGCLVTATREQVCRYIIGHVIRFLEEHGTVNLFREEQSMQRCRYPEYPEHKSQHDRFKEEVASLRNELDHPDPARTCASYELSVEANRLIIDWTREHMARADKELGIFFREEMCVSG